MILRKTWYRRTRLWIYKYKGWFFLGLIPLFVIREIDKPNEMEQPKEDITELFYDVEWMKDDVNKLQDDQKRTAKWEEAAALSLMIMGMTLVISSLVQLLL